MTKKEDCEQKHWDDGQIYNWVKAHVVFLLWQVQTDIINIYVWKIFDQIRHSSYHHNIIRPWSLIEDLTKREMRNHQDFRWA